MLALTIEAKSVDSALGFAGALSDFDAELIETADGKHLVRAGIHGNDHQAVRLLDALEAYITLTRIER
jgi:succinylglutamate desuccinylase